MTDWVHISLDVILVVASLAFAFYCFRLINKFFKGGIFESSFKAFLASGLFVAAGTFLDMLEESAGFEVFPIHIWHVLYVFSLVALFYGVYALHKAWAKLGLR